MDASKSAVRCHDYRVTLTRAGAFTWDRVIPPALTEICSHMGWKLGDEVQPYA